MSVAHFRPRLPDDVLFAPTPGGVAFLTQGGVVRMNGPSIHQWVERLAAHLDGSRTVAELTAELPDDRRVFVTGLLTAMRERGLVVNADEPGLLRIDSGTIAALVVEDDRFGDLVPALAAGMRRLGLRVWQGTGDEFAGEAVVHVAAADRAGLARADRLDQMSAERGLPITHVLLREGEAWWSDSAPLAAGWMRLSAMEADPPPAGRVSVSPVAAAVVAGQVVADLGRRLSETPAAAGRPRLRVVDLARLDTRTHTFLPHYATLPPAQEAAPADALGEEDFSRRAAMLMDSRIGVFGEIDEGPYGQLPLHVSATTVADPSGLLGAERPRVIGVGSDFATSRYRAALNALTTHALLAVDPRRLLGADGQSLAPPDAPPAVLRELLIEVADGLPAFVPARDLNTHSEVRLAARDVFTLSGSGPIPPGAAAAYSAGDALVAGLLGCCAELAAPEGPLPAVDPGRSDPELARSLALLDAIGRRYQVLDASDRMGVPVYVGTLDGRLVARAAGTTPLDAARATVEGLLAACQGIPCGVPERPLAATQGSPKALASSTPALDAAELAAALARKGLRVYAVALDHDREVHALMPHVVRVVTEPAHA